jgi:hypothetical protein
MMWLALWFGFNMGILLVAMIAIEVRDYRRMVRILNQGPRAIIIDQDNPPDTPFEDMVTSTGTFKREFWP